MKRMIVAGLAGLALAAAPLAASQASSTACQAAAASGCQTPVVAVATSSANALTPADDFALQYAGPASAAAYGAIRTNTTSSTLADGTEDWTWKQITTVPATGRGIFGFTRFDNANFGGAPVYELKYTPLGVDSRLCLTISSKYRSNGAVLGNCVRAAQQSFIVTQTAPGLETLAAPQLPATINAYYYAFDVSQNRTITQQHHLALLAPHAHHNHELVAAGSPVYVGAGLASLDEWSTTP
jgi:hypothetical protein